jgi:predicted DNA-binding transcriptional regulator AlpA
MPPDQDQRSAGRWYESKDVADRYGFSIRFLYKLIKNGTFPSGRKIGRLRRWHDDDLRKFEASRSQAEGGDA